MDKLTLNVAEAAKLIGLDKQTVYELCKTEGFPSITVGRRIIIPYASLTAWLDQQAMCKEAT